MVLRKSEPAVIVSECRVGFERVETVLELRRNEGVRQIVTDRIRPIRVGCSRPVRPHRGEEGIDSSAREGNETVKRVEESRTRLAVVTRSRGQLRRKMPDSVNAVRG